MSDTRRPDDAELRDKLSEEQYRVTREGHTERPFTGKYVDCKEDGVYRRLVDMQTELARVRAV